VALETRVEATRHPARLRDRVLHGEGTSKVRSPVPRRVVASALIGVSRILRRLDRAAVWRGSDSASARVANSGEHSSARPPGRRMRYRIRALTRVRLAPQIAAQKTCARNAIPGAQHVL